VVFPWYSLVEYENGTALVDFESLVEGSLDDVTSGKPCFGELVELIEEFLSSDLGSYCEFFL
jgi:hypothetical protein